MLQYLRVLMCRVNFRTLVMKTLNIRKYLLLLSVIFIVGCDTVSPDYLSLTEAELRSYTHCKVSFQCELVNCAVGKEPFQYRWQVDTMTYQIEWDSTGFHAERKYSYSKDWIDVDMAGSHIHESDSKMVRSYISNGNDLDSVFLIHSNSHSHHALHISADGNQNDFVHCNNVPLVEKSGDSVVYYVKLNAAPDKLDSVSYFNYDHFNGYGGTTNTCGISWQNNVESYIRLVLFKK